MGKDDLHTYIFSFFRFFFVSSFKEYFEMLLDDFKLEINANGEPLREYNLSDSSLGVIMFINSFYHLS